MERLIGNKRIGIKWFCLIISIFFINTLAMAADKPSGIRIGVRKDCPPFSYEVDGKGRYRGYSVNLCEEIANRNNLSISYVSVTAQDRFIKLNNDEIDILCEATTVTLKRMHRFGTTMYTFISGASLMYAPGTARAPEIKIGVLKGTTTENAIESILRKQTDMKLNPFNYKRLELNSHLDCVEKFINKKINIYIADREILLAIRAMALKKKEKLIVSKRYYTMEPYALFIGKDNHDLKNMANKTLTQIFKQEINDFFRQNFPQNKMNDSLRHLFRLQQLLEGQEPLPPK